MITIGTWNVNSIRVREERLAALLERHAPDVLLLQETKITDDAFPAARLHGLGYHAVVHGQKTYNGVAVLVRRAWEGLVSDVRAGMADGVEDPQARFLSVRIGGARVVSVYVPNGSEPTSEKFVYKLGWLRRLRAWLDRHATADERLVVGGDWNVAPDDRDVARPDEWKDTVLCTPDARAALADVMAFGLTDLFRAHHQDGGHYSWWDYRALGFPKNNGLRIDHVLATPPAVRLCAGCEIDRDERRGVQPSDHAPVLARFQDALFETGSGNVASVGAGPLSSKSQSPGDP